MVQSGMQSGAEASLDKLASLVEGR